MEAQKPPARSLKAYMRAYLEIYAKSKHFDPLIATNWYNVQRKQIMKTKVGETFTLNSSLAHFVFRKGTYLLDITTEV